MSDNNYTRGNGLFEKVLAVKRSEIANKLILNKHREGRLLDIGCGNYPFFITKTGFKEKYGIDKIIDEKIKLQSTKLIGLDFEVEPFLPFKNNFFDIVTMLAVIEHMEFKKAITLISEIYRILKPEGRYILTTPCPWSEKILNIMSKIKLVSPEEIEEHKVYYSHILLGEILTGAGFKKDSIKTGYFEFNLNIWAFAVK